jgi:hypothetical protein
MKVDIEGWESHFLSGGAEQLALPEAPPLLIEFNADAAESAGSSVDQMRGQLVDFGYKLYRLGTSDYPLEPICDTGSIGRSLNVIALKDPEVAVRRLQNTEPSNFLR